MPTHPILGGNVQLYRRAKSPYWFATATIAGKQRKKSTKETSLALAKDWAEDWYLGLMGKAKSGTLSGEMTFRKAAERFLKEYAVITEGQRSPRWVESHEIRLRVHILPFFGELGLSEVTAGKAQEYRIHRNQTWMLPNPHAKGKKPIIKPPSLNTLHNEFITINQVLKSAIRHGDLAHLPNLSPPYKKQNKRVHRPWFSPAEYKQLYKASGAYAKEPFHDHYKWNAEQLHDFILFMANTGLRPDEAKNLQHRDIEIVEDEDTNERILEIEVRGKRGYGFCKSMPNAVRPYERLLNRRRPAEHLSRRDKQRLRREGKPVPDQMPLGDLPKPTDPVFTGDYTTIFNGLLDRAELKLDRDGNPRTAYSLRHTYICMRLMEGADIYQIAKNCRTSVQMIEKHYAAHIKNTLDASSINRRRVKLVKKKRPAPSTVVYEDDDIAA